MRLTAKVVVGFWQRPRCTGIAGIWARVAAAWEDAQNGKIARFGDNMREVAVTDGDKVEAQFAFRLFSSNGYGRVMLLPILTQVSDAEIDKIARRNMNKHTLLLMSCVSREAKTCCLLDSARIEVGIKPFLEARVHSKDLPQHLKICMV